MQSCFPKRLINVGELLPRHALEYYEFLRLLKIELLRTKALYEVVHLLHRVSFEESSINSLATPRQSEHNITRIWIIFCRLLR